MTTAALKQQVSHKKESKHTCQSKKKNTQSNCAQHLKWHSFYDFSSTSRCLKTMAFTHGCSAGWLASVCALTSARWLHTGCVKTGTRPSCTSWLPDTLACRLKFSCRTRRALCSYLLRLWRPRLSPRTWPLQTVLHLWSRGLMPPCHRDFTPAASMVSWNNIMLLAFCCPQRIFVFQRAKVSCCCYCVMKSK